MNHNLEIQKILIDLDRLTDYDDRIAMLQQAIKIADANRDIDWGFDLRMSLIRCEQYTNHSRESLPAFAWILDVHDSNPGLFSDIDVLYEYKWISGVLFNNLNISLEQVDNILYDFRKRLTNAGYSSREYFNIKVNQSLFKSEKILAREYLTLRDNEPLDNLSSVSNDLATTIYVEMIEGDFESAIAHITEYTGGVSKKNVIPVYSGLIYYLGGKKYDPLIEKYFDEAEEEFSKRKKYPFQLYEMSLLMYYMAKYRKDKAWEYFEQFVNWEIGAEEALQFDFALSILPLFKDGGTRIIDVISIRQPYYRDDQVYDLCDLYEYYKILATDLANQFDIRNQNKHFSEQVQDEMKYLENN